MASTLLLTLTPGYLFAEGETLTVAKLNQALRITGEISGAVDGTQVALSPGSVVSSYLAADAVTTAKLADAAVTTAKVADLAITEAKLSTGLAAWVVRGGFASGDLKMTATTTTPDGWLECDGAALSRASYAALFAAIGTAYGAGDGSSTFNVPDLRGRVPMGAGTGAGLTARALGDKTGAETVALSIANLPAHDHGLGGKAVYVSGGTANPGDGSGWGNWANATSQGSGTAHNNMQPSLGVRFVIKT